MPTWVKYMLALVIPAFSFLILKDTVGGFYYGSQAQDLSYVVVEPEEVAEPDVEIAEVIEEAPVEAEATLADEPVEPEEVTIAETDSPIGEEVSEETLAEVDVVPEAEPETLAPDEAPETQLVAVLSDDEMEAAARAARACASCHQFERERNGAGPHLVGVGGRTVGSVDGFRYSGALQELNMAGAVWTADALEEWLAGPSNYAPGTKMNFVVRDAEERRLIAEWLMQKDK